MKSVYGTLASSAAGLVTLSLPNIEIGVRIMGASVFIVGAIFGAMISYERWKKERRERKRQEREDRAAEKLDEIKIAQELAKVAATNAIAIESQKHTNPTVSMDIDGMARQANDLNGPTN